MHVVQKREEPPLLVEVKEVIQAKLNEEHLCRAQELNLRVRGLPPPAALLDPLHIGTSFLHNTLDLKDLGIEHAWMGPDFMLFLCFHTPKD